MIEWTYQSLTFSATDSTQDALKSTTNLLNDHMHHMTSQHSLYEVVHMTTNYMSTEDSPWVD